MISPARWDNWSSSHAGILNNQLKITTTTSTNYYGMDSGANNATYDLTGSFVSNLLVDAGNQSLNSFEAHPVLVRKKDDSSNELLFFVRGNTVYARKIVGGSTTTIHTASYNSAVHKYFRIREASGTILL